MTKILTSDLLLTLAAIAHESNRAFCRMIGDDTQVSWDRAPEWQKDTAVNGIALALGGANPEQLHESWLVEKAKMGTVYGPVKDMDADPPLHPCMVPYDQLPAEQRRKDHLYSAVVRAAYQALTSESSGLCWSCGRDSSPANMLDFDAVNHPVAKVQIPEEEGGLKSHATVVVVGGSSAAPSLVGTQEQEMSNAAFFSFHCGHTTLAQACAALGWARENPEDLKAFQAAYAAWAALSIGSTDAYGGPADDEEVPTLGPDEIAASPTDPWPRGTGIGGIMFTPEEIAAAYGIDPQPLKDLQANNLTTAED
jgi:hypothetical protein